MVPDLSSRLQRGCRAVVRLYGDELAIIVIVDTCMKLLEKIEGQDEK